MKRRTPIPLALFALARFDRNIDADVMRHGIDAVTLKSFVDGVALGVVLGVRAAVLPSGSAARMSILEGLRTP